MSELEQEIIQKIHELDGEQQKRVLAFISTIEPEPFDYDAWFRGVKALHAELRAEGRFFNVQNLLDELREERVDDILNSLRR